MTVLLRGKVDFRFKIVDVIMKAFMMIKASLHDRNIKITNIYVLKKKPKNT
jgi:hypothetical protein